ncbi:MAG: MiaB/RimO family radical SAM methylthiotransferase [bacterium]|nr:MiaB/RimO family radical SAM methylthiotransferase [bacterium]
MKYYLLIIGCQMNYSDAERISHILNQYGGTRVSDQAKADYIFVVSCSVRQPAMDRIFGHLPQWNKWRKKKKVKTVLTGCVLPKDRIQIEQDFDYFFEVKDIPNLPKILGLKKTNKKIISNADYLNFKPNYESKFQAYIPIMTGCNNYCTFCAVPYTRGAEASRLSSEIIKEIKGLIKNGYKEITLLGQNVNAYLDPDIRHDKKILDARSRKYWEFDNNQPIQKRIASTKVPKDFAKLLTKINSIPGNFWIRFLSSNPQDVSDELIKTLPKLKKVTPYFHFALQSGDDEILRKMNRRHTSKNYLDLVRKIRLNWPGVTISTDIIVGFCGETDKQFRNSAQLMEKVKFDMVYISEYSTRPETTADKFFEDDISIKTKKRRKAILNKILIKHATQLNSKFVGNNVRVLVEKYNPKTKENIGKTDKYKTIHLKGRDMTGHFVTAKVSRANTWGLYGKLI